MNKLIVLAATVLFALTGCGVTGSKVPEPVPDHAAPDTAGFDVYLSATAVNDAYAERYVIGEAQALDKNAKPMLGRDEKTQQETIGITPFKVFTTEGDAMVKITYVPGVPVFFDITAHLQGQGGDSLYMEIIDPKTDRVMPQLPGGVDLCTVDKQPGKKGVCTVHSRVVVL